jgi:peptidoglycan hydrolase CwlO-like protein
MLKTKYCRACKTEHPIERFKPNNFSKDGYTHKCMQSFAIYKHQKKKVKQLSEDIEQRDGLIKTISEKYDALKIKCEIAEKKYREYQDKYELLVQDLKDLGRWPVKG